MVGGDASWSQVVFSGVGWSVVTVGGGMWCVLVVL